MPQLAPAPRTIAVLRALWLGDLLCAVPTLRSLRAAWPSAHLALVGLPWAAELVERFPHYLDELILMPGVPGLIEQEPDPPAVERFVAEMQARRFDLSIQLQGNGTVANAFVARWSARRTAGFYPPGGSAPDPETFIPYPDTGREVARLLRILEPLGVRSLGDRLELPIRRADEQALAALPESALLRPLGYAIVHPGSRGENRRWSPIAFARVADALAHEGLTIVLTGSEDERGLTAAVAAAMRPTRPVNLAGRTTLGALAALVDRARLVVCNDTGISHVADALGTPSVIVSLDGEPERWAPANRALHRVLDMTAGAAEADVLAAALDLVGVAGARVA